MIKQSLEKDPVITDMRIWVAVFLTITPMLVMFFRPTFLEFVGFYLVDIISYRLSVAADIHIFRHYWPHSRLFFPSLDPQLLEIKDLGQRRAIYRHILTFPRDRALSLGLLSVVKVIPGFIFVILVWRGNTGIPIAVLKGLCICAFTFSFAIGMSYIGYHNRISVLLQEVHQKADWSDVFKATDLLPQDKLFRRFEIVAATSVWAFWTFMIVLIVTSPGLSTWESVGQALYVSVAGLYFSAQLISASRKQIIQGLQYLVQFHDQSSETVRSKGLALSTNPTLAFYQRTLNELIDKNIESEKEVHRWILRQAEDSRYLQLGRLTGLLVHDLLTPLTVMRYSLSVLDEQKAVKEASQSYFERLRFSIDQTTDFIKNIRSSIRDQSSGYREALVPVAHESALKMVSYLHEREPFSRIAIDCQLDPELRATVPQPELNQVFLNLYTNAVKNLLDNKIVEPRLSIQCAWEDEEQFILVIKDNGTGLSAETFEYITEEAERLPGHEGIGLKLTKRLIELYGGRLALVQPSNKVGSEFHLTLHKPRRPERARPIPKERLPMTPPPGEARHPPT